MHEERHDERHGERLSDEELQLFVQYLHRFANHDVDIFLRLEAGDPEHPVYVLFGRDYPPLVPLGIRQFMTSSQPITIRQPGRPEPSNSPWRPRTSRC